MPIAAVKVGDSVQQGLDSFFGFIPNVLGFLVILLIGWIIAKAVRAAVNRGGAQGFEYLTGVWPGEKTPDPK